MAPRKQMRNVLHHDPSKHEQEQQSYGKDVLHA